MAWLLDEEVKHLVGRNYQRGRALLQANVEVLRALSAEVKERETLEGRGLQERPEALRVHPHAPTFRAIG